MNHGRIFISAVSGEFKTARDALAKDLIERGFDVTWQEAFPANVHAETLHRKLHDLVMGCDGVICLQGTRSGSFPPSVAAASFATMLPPDIPEASRTQWEIFFAQALSKEFRLFRAHKDWNPDIAEPERPDLAAAQTCFWTWLTREDIPWRASRSSGNNPSRRSTKVTTSAVRIPSTLSSTKPWCWRSKRSLKFSRSTKPGC